MTAIWQHFAIKLAILRVIRTTNHKTIKVSGAPLLPEPVQRKTFIARLAWLS